MFGSASVLTHLTEPLSSEGREVVFGLPSVRVGTIFGIPIEVNMSWLLVFVLISLTLAFGYFPLVFSGYATWVYLFVGAFTAVAFFTSILVHEVSHSLVARAWGMPVKRVTLFIFGGVSQIEEEPSSPGREFGMAIAGPLASLVLGALFFLSFTIASAAQVAPWIAGPLDTTRSGASCTSSEIMAFNAAGLPGA